MVIGAAAEGKDVGNQGWNSKGTEREVVRCRQIPSSISNSSSPENTDKVELFRNSKKGEGIHQIKIHRI